MGATQSLVESESDVLKVSICEDAYDVVFVSCFGYMQTLGHHLVHPGFLFLLALPLFLGQVSVIMFLFLSVDIEEPVRNMETTSDVTWMCKIVVIIFLQVMMFKELFLSLHLLVFALNPATWMDIVPSARIPKDSKLWTWPVLLPCGIASIVMKLLVAYVVLSASASIILVSRTPQDAIFNGMAIVFISDMDEFLYKFYNKIWHIHIDDGEDGQGMVLQRGHDRPVVHKSCACLHRGRGGGRFMAFFTSFCVFFYYCRQVLVVLVAIHTNVLPLTRDVCSLTHCNDETSLGWSHQCLFYAVFRHFILADISDELSPHKEYCTADHMPMTHEDALHMVTSQPWQALGYIAVFFVILVMPQCRYIFNVRGNRQGYSNIPASSAYTHNDTPSPLLEA